MNGATQDVILFDGICVLCSRWYRFVTARDKARRFRFVAIQQAEGRAIAEAHNIDPDNPATFILLTPSGAHTRSDAILRIVAALPGWRWVAVLRIVPAPLRDALYGVIARNRYRWFGMRDTCLLPDAVSGDQSHQDRRRPPA